MHGHPFSALGIASAPCFNLFLHDLYCMKPIILCYILSSLLPQCSTPKQYNVAADFTLSAKKRKRNGTEEGDPAEEREEGEQQGEKTPIAKKQKRSDTEGDTAGKEEGEVEVKTPVTKKHKKDKKMKREQDFDFSTEGDAMETSVTVEATDNVEAEVNIVISVWCGCVCGCVGAQNLCNHTSQLSLPVCTFSLLFTLCRRRRSQRRKRKRRK